MKIDLEERDKGVRRKRELLVVRNVATFAEKVDEARGNGGVLSCGRDLGFETIGDNRATIVGAHSVLLGDTHGKKSEDLRVL